MAVIIAPLSIDDQIKQVDLEIKKKDLAERGKWAWAKHPVVVAAAVTA